MKPLFLRVLRHPEFRRGFWDMAHAALGIAAWGLMTGVAMVKFGMGTTEALLMALAVFAGSAQLATTRLMMAGAPMAVVLATAFCVNLRFVVFSAHLRAYVMHLPRWQRLFAGYMTGDLTYVMFVRRHPVPAAPEDVAQRQAHMAYLCGNCCMNWFSWTSASVIGVLAADAVPPAWGLGFAGILALVGLACALASSALRWVSAGAAAVVGVAGFALPLKLNILLAIAVAVALCLALEPVVARPAASAEGPP